MLSCHIDCYQPMYTPRLRLSSVILNDQFGQNSESKMMEVPSSIPFGDKHYLAHHDLRATNKMHRNIENISKNILKLRPGQTKKYQVSGYHEYKKLVKFIEKHRNVYPDIQFDILTSETLRKNKVKRIIGGINSGCCRECDTLPTYVSEKVPVVYFVATKTVL